MPIFPNWETYNNTHQKLTNWIHKMLPKQKSIPPKQMPTSIGSNYTLLVIFMGSPNLTNHQPLNRFCSPIILCLLSVSSLPRYNLHFMAFTNNASRRRRLEKIVNKKKTKRRPTKQPVYSFLHPPSQSTVVTQQTCMHPADPVTILQNRTHAPHSITNDNNDQHNNKTGLDKKSCWLVLLHTREASPTPHTCIARRLNLYALLITNVTVILVRRAKEWRLLLLLLLFKQHAVNNPHDPVKLNHHHPAPGWIDYNQPTNKLADWLTAPLKKW